jgi:cytochrome c oxidase subunit II
MKRKQLLFLAIATLTLVLMLSACGVSNNNNASNTNNPSNTNNASNTTPPPVSGGQTKEITVTATNFVFDPQAIQLNVGDTVKLTLKNVNGGHGFAIPDLNVNLKNGETATFTVNKAGTFDYNCSIQCGAGHDNMTGTITVT